MKTYTKDEVIKLIYAYENYLMGSIGRDGYYNGIDFVEEFLKENPIK